MGSTSFSRSRRRARIGSLATVVIVLLSLAPTAVAVPFGRSLALDGVDDYATLSDNASLDLGDTDGEDFTLETFLYVPNLTEDTNQLLFYKGNAYSLAVNFRSATPDTVVFRFYSGPTTYSSLLNTDNIGVGWHHVAAVFDNEWSPSNDRAAIYLDGSEFASSSAFELTPGINNSTQLLCVGSNSGAVPFHGYLEEARFSSSVRYSGPYVVPAGAFAVDGNTQALWHFDEAGGVTTFADASPNANTLTGLNGVGTSPFGDATPPDTTIDSGPSGTVASASADFVFSATEPGSTFQCRLDAGGWAACTSPKSYAGLSDGVHTFEVAATDEASNPDPTPASRTWTIDTTLPPSRQPDAQIRLVGAAAFEGVGLYDLHGMGQTVSKKVKPGRTVSFDLRVRNDGNVADAFTIDGCAATKGLKVNYLDPPDIVVTPQVIAGTYAIPGLDAGQSKDLVMVVKATTRARPGTSLTCPVAVTSQGDGSKIDVVKAKVTVR